MSVTAGPRRAQGSRVYGGSHTTCVSDFSRSNYDWYVSIYIQPHSLVYVIYQTYLSHLVLLSTYGFKAPLRESLSPSGLDQYSDCQAAIKHFSSGRIQLADPGQEQVWAGGLILIDTSICRSGIIDSHLGFSTETVYTQLRAFDAKPT